jgi:hypothetical protein
LLKADATSVEVTDHFSKGCPQRIVKWKDRKGKSKDKKTEVCLASDTIGQVRETSVHSVEGVDNLPEDFKHVSAFDWQNV